MLVATFLRYFKVYRGINFVPITTGDLFSAYIGENGVGKSSILEALDCYFNGGEWNINIESKEKGYKEREPYISPIFLINKDEIKTGNKSINDSIFKLSDCLWNASETDFNQSQIKIAKQFIKFRERLKEKYNHEEYALVAAGRDYQNNPQLSILGTLEEAKAALGGDEDSIKRTLEAINGFLVKKHSYIYIPAEVNALSYTKLENKSIQELMGENINEAISSVISDEQIKGINNGLNEFVESIGKRLNGYKYKKPAKRQKNLTRDEINSKVIEAFFSIRILNKTTGSNEIPVHQLSSGEKRKALIDVASSFLCSDEKKKKDIILAIDEPEASLHTSACFDQFDSLVKISDKGHQVLTTTHWYGFIPAVSHGIANLTEKNSNSDVSIKAVELHQYRESIQKETKETKGAFPSDVSLKSVNDLIQSIMSSIRRDDPYYWLICEGASEKEYFERLLGDEVKAQKLRILPVGGAKSVLRIFKYLELPMQEDKKYLKGKVFCLIDTDSQIISCNANDYPNLVARRLLTNNNNVDLVKIDSQHVSPATEIEDCLNAENFIGALGFFTNDKCAESILKSIDAGSVDFSGYARFEFNLRPSEEQTLKEFFDNNDGENKIKFAKAYNAYSYLSGHNRLEWVDEIKRFLY